MRTRITLSLVIILGCISAAWIYRSVQGPYVADMALQQMENDDEAAAAGRAAAVEDIDGVMVGVAMLLLITLWSPAVVRLFKQGAKITVPHIEVRSTKKKEDEISS